MNIRIKYKNKTRKTVQKNITNEYNLLRTIFLKL